MSRGFGAHADLVAQDNETVISQYGGYNLNEPVIAYRTFGQYFHCNLIFLEIIIFLNIIHSGYHIKQTGF